MIVLLLPIIAMLLLPLWLCPNQEPKLKRPPTTILISLSARIFIFDMTHPQMGKIIISSMCVNAYPFAVVYLPCNCNFEYRQEI